MTIHLSVDAFFNTPNPDGGERIVLPLSDQEVSVFSLWEKRLSCARDAARQIRFRPGHASVRSTAAQVKGHYALRIEHFSRAFCSPRTQRLPVTSFTTLVACPRRDGSPWAGMQSVSRIEFSHTRAISTVESRPAPARSSGRSVRLSISDGGRGRVCRLHHIAVERTSSRASFSRQESHVELLSRSGLMRIGITKRMFERSWPESRARGYSPKARPPRSRGAAPRLFDHK
jgi:hypothetical protein